MFKYQKINQIKSELLLFGSNKYECFDKLSVIAWEEKFNVYYLKPFNCLKYLKPYTGWSDKIVVLKKTTLQLYFKTFIEKNQFLLLDHVVELTSIQCSRLQPQSPP